jgi:hypothetical protein
MDKAYILQEIRRIAQANDGVAPGSARFQSETGIKDTQWRGVYWAGWSEALREAGFAPNQYQQPFDKEELLEKYAKLARGLGQLPSQARLRLQAHRDPEFPSDSTFDNRFGPKAKLVEQLLDYCRSRSAYDDVIHLCGNYLSSLQQARSRPASNVGEVGFVYLVKSGRFYKIGKTNAAGRREYELDIQLPESVKTIHIIRTDDPGGIEAYWHKRFEAKRKKGEWFELTAEDVTAFKRRKFM